MENDFNQPWYALDWFTNSTLHSFTWENTLFLYLAGAVPIIFLIRWLWRYRFNQKLPVALQSKNKTVSSPINIIRFLPEILYMLASALIAVALAIINGIVE